MTNEQNLGAEILRWWWANLGDRQSGRARALAARLRRAQGLDALIEPEVHDLARMINQRDGERLANLVCLLAAVREHIPKTLARGLGGAEPKLSTLRFQRLMRAEGGELIEGLRRAIIIADGRCNVARLGLDILHWGEGVRAQWCFHYFGADAPDDPVDDTLKEISE